MIDRVAWPRSNMNLTLNPHPLKNQTPKGAAPISVNLMIDCCGVPRLCSGMALNTEDLTIENWAVLRTFLPAGWEEMARRSGALCRARDFPDAESLLRVLLLHIGNGCSLAETAVRARYLGIHVSPVAVFKRLRASEEWLRWLAEHLRGQQRLAMATHGRRVRAVDGTSVSEPGSTGTDWRVHYAINLADLQCDFFAITSVAGGETLRRVPVRAGDILLGDRIYATSVGVAHVAKAGADIVVRLHRRALPLFDAAGKRVNLLRRFASLEVGKVQQWNTRVPCADGNWISGRLVAVRRACSRPVSSVHAWNAMPKSIARPSAQTVGKPPRILPPGPLCRIHFRPPRFWSCTVCAGKSNWPSSA